MQGLSSDRLLNAIPEGVIAIDSQGFIVTWNEAASHILSISPDRTIGGRIKDIAPAMELEQVLVTGEQRFYEDRETGSRHLLISQAPVRDENNIIIGAVAVFLDPVARGLVSEDVTSLRQVRLLLEAIIDATQDVISVADANGNLMIVNQAYTRVIGLNKQEVVGKPATVDISEGESMHLHVMKTLEPVYGVPLQVGPQKREVIVNAAPVMVGGELKGSVIVAHDVSEIRRLTDELYHMKSLVRCMQTRYTFDDIVAAGPAMKKAVDLARKAAASSVTVLLNGESGTGKELFAHAIHHASQRKSGPFVRVNCTAIPETLMESELFGYEAGAFTGALKRGKKGYFEEANGGTLFLDEIGEVPLHLQSKLLRALQEKEITRVGGTKTISVQIRIIAATNRDLWHDVVNGTFREDLYYRINVFPIIIPPLRQRLSEFPQLVRHMLRKLNMEYGRNVERISEEALAILQGYRWPGNVRELENILARSMISMAFNEMELIVAHLPPLDHSAGSIKASVAGGEEGAMVPTLEEAVEQAERLAIGAALRGARYNKTAAARLLGISVRNLYYKMEKYNMAESE